MQPPLKHRLQKLTSRTLYDFQDLNQISGLFLVFHDFTTKLDYR